MPRVVRCALTGDEVAVSMPRRSPLADQSNASRTLEMQHRFARCDADWAEEAIAANRKGESGDELGQGWGKGKVATRLGKVLEFFNERLDLMGGHGRMVAGGRQTS